MTKKQSTSNLPTTTDIIEIGACLRQSTPFPANTEYKKYEKKYEGEV